MLPLLLISGPSLAGRGAAPGEPHYLAGALLQLHAMLNNLSVLLFLPAYRRAIFGPASSTSAASTALECAAATR